MPCRGTACSRGRLAQQQRSPGRRALLLLLLGFPPTRQHLRASCLPLSTSHSGPWRCRCAPWLAVSRRRGGPFLRPSRMRCVAAGRCMAIDVAHAKPLQHCRLRCRPKRWWRWHSRTRPCALPPPPPPSRQISPPPPSHTRGSMALLAPSLQRSCTAQRRCCVRGRRMPVPLWLRPPLPPSPTDPCPGWQYRPRAWGGSASVPLLSTGHWLRAALRAPLPPFDSQPPCGRGWQRLGPAWSPAAPAVDSQARGMCQRR